MKVRSRAVVGALLVGLALIASQTAGAGPLFAEEDPADSLAQTSPRFASLDEAVAAGKLAASVASTLRERGAVEAFVTFRGPSPREEGLLSADAHKRLWKAL